MRFKLKVNHTQTHHSQTAENHTKPNQTKPVTKSLTPIRKRTNNQEQLTLSQVLENNNLNNCEFVIRNHKEKKTLEPCIYSVEEMG